MARIARRWPFLSAAIAVAAIACASHLALRKPSGEAAFEYIKVGMTLDEVNELVGDELAVPEETVKDMTRVQYYTGDERFSGRKGVGSLFRVNTSEKV
jgi:hypothetical protein